MIRITGGTFRSRKLFTPETDSTKPTMDRVREGIFSALHQDINNASVLDLFAGSGSYGFESLSRGAKFATFVENNQIALASLKKNVELLKVESQSKINSMDYISFLERNNEKFDIVFVDPPYKAYSYQDIVSNIFKNDSLAKFGIIVLESEDDLEIDENLFAIVKKYKYGLAKVYILRK